MVDESRRNLMGLIPGAALLGAATLGSAVAVTSAAAQSEDGTWERILRDRKLRIGAAVAEPWFFKDTSGGDAEGGIAFGGSVWRGVGPTLVKHIAKELDVELEVVETTWGTAAAALQAGQFDIMLPLTPSLPRAQAVDFVNSPAFYFAVCLIARDGFEPKTWVELNDPAVRVGVTHGTSHDHWMSGRTPKATFSRMQDAAGTYAAFQAGRVDAIVLSSPEAATVLAKMGRGHIVLPKPNYPVRSLAAVRPEPNNRWKSFLELAMAYFYDNGITQQAYEDFLAFRGIDPSTAVPLIKELW